MPLFDILTVVALALAGLNTLILVFLWRALNGTRHRIGFLQTASQRLEREMGQHRYAMAMLRQLQKEMRDPREESKSDEELLNSAVEQLDEAAEEQLAQAETVAETAPETEADGAEPSAAVTPEAEMPKKAAQASVGTQASLAGLKDDEILQFIRKAVKTNNLTIHVQPIVSLPGREPKYHEVFARIKVNNGFIPAKDFVSVAKNHNLIAAIDNLLLLRCLQLLKSSTSGGTGELFINVSAQTFANRKYMDDLIEFLSNNPKLSSRLVFEMTQQDSIKLNATIRGVMEGLSLLGCRFSMDQVTIFGMDMNRLMDQHISFVKLDANAVIREIADMSGHKRFRKIKNTLDSQGVAVIIEKVENEKQLFNILDLHIDYGQGYLFGAPSAV